MPTDPQAGPSVLVVEDDGDIRDLLSFRLSRAGFSVHEASDGESGLAAVAAIRPDVVLLDWMMPGMDGLEVCRRLRADPDTAAIPVVLLTARARDLDVERGLAAGVDAYIAKPFTPAELLEAVRTALAARSRSGGPAPV
jgi:two-component system phosphate regulon response regulator PhoB